MSALLRPLWSVWKRVERKSSIDSTHAVVVLGFPRSGTSIVGRMVQACNVSFGGEDGLRPSDSRNPNGYLERIIVNRIDEWLMREAGHRSTFTYSHSSELRANGFFNKISRLMTRRLMLSTLSQLSLSSRMWGIKLFPITFHIWKQYLPHAKIVAVYRAPQKNADSLVRTFMRHTYGQALELWTQHNAELLYHLTHHEHILISQDALEDPQKVDAEIKRLITFLGAGDPMKLRAMVGEKPEARAQESFMTLSEPTQRVWDALQKKHAQHTTHNGSHA